MKLKIYLQKNLFTFDGYKDLIINALPLLKNIILKQHVLYFNLIGKKISGMN